MDCETTVHIRTMFETICAHVDDHHHTIDDCVVVHILVCVSYTWPELLTLDGCMRAVREAALHTL